MGGRCRGEDFSRGRCMGRVQEKALQRNSERGWLCLRGETRALEAPSGRPNLARRGLSRETWAAAVRCFRGANVMHGTVSGLVAYYGYAVLFFLVGLESLGIPLPGETALVTAAAFAALGHLSISAVIATAIAAAIIGDNGGASASAGGGSVPLRRHLRAVR